MWLPHKELNYPINYGIDRGKEDGQEEGWEVTGYSDLFLKQAEDIMPPVGGRSRGSS